MARGSMRAKAKSRRGDLALPGEEVLRAALAYRTGGAGRDVSAGGRGVARVARMAVKLTGGRYVRWEFPRLQIDDGLALVADLRKQAPHG